MTGPSTADRARRDAPACVRRDLPLLWIDVRFASATLKRHPDAAVLAADGSATAVVDRVEDELHGEATRYRHALWACIAVGLMPFLLAAFAWSGMYWLPVRIPWYPFERGLYGLPWLSLYEWFAYLFLAVFFAYAIALIAESAASTHRLSADYHRLVDAGARAREDFAREVASAKRPRTELVLRRSAVFADYLPLLDTPTTRPAPSEKDAG